MKTDKSLLSKSNPFLWMSYALLDWAIILLAGTIAVKSKNILVFWISSLVIGNRQHALAFLGHDGAHRSASKKYLLNDLLTCVFAFWPIGVGLKGYRKFHFSHHRQVGTASDPELIHKTWAAPEFSLPMTKSKILFYLLRDLTGYGLRDIINLVRLTPPASVLDALGPFTVNALFWFFSIRSGHPQILALWYFSQVSSFWATFRLRVWIEHIGTTETIRVSLAKWQQLIFAPHGAAFHYEHHRWPSIPCWNLQKARQIDSTEPITELKDLIKKFESHSPIASGSLPQKADLNRKSA